MLLLAAIALMPFIAKHWWEKHYPKLTIGLALLPPFYYFVILRQPWPWLAAMGEYLSFIILLASLYVISGGIVIRVNQKATPAANALLLLLGAIIANIFGTTGASMLLIRPFLRMNRGHIKPFHIVFFIFIVSNCGGLLTPIGDPPLFLGYLQGIPFRWTVDHLWPIWAVANGALLALFYILDTIDHGRTDRVHHHDGGAQVHILGIHNFVFISAVLFAVFRPGLAEAAAHVATFGFTLTDIAQLLLSREVLMVLAALASQRFTSRQLYQHNEFSYAPIREVAILFIGIFSTMAPALGWLEQNANTLRVKTPGQFYYTSGTLSSFLDNAPTYLTFLQIRLGGLEEADVAQANAILSTMHKTGDTSLPSEPSEPSEGTLSPQVRAAVESAVINHRDAILSGTLSDAQVRVGFLLGNPALDIFIVAISAGAVLFGACTYIGNGPNFMVKSIAQSHGCPAPGFLRYILCYSLPILIPLYTLIWLIFLR